MQTAARGGIGAVARIGEMGDLCKCSFCGSSQRQVNKLIAGPGVWICDNCVGLCVELLDEQGPYTPKRGVAPSPQKFALGRWVNRINLQDTERVREAKEFLEGLLVRLNRSQSSPP